MKMTLDCFDANEVSCQALVSYAHDGDAYHWHAALWEGGHLRGGVDGDSASLDLIAQDVSVHVQEIRITRQHAGPV